MPSPLEYGGLMNLKMPGSETGSAKLSGASRRRALTKEPRPRVREIRFSLTRFARLLLTVSRLTPNSRPSSFSVGNWLSGA